MKTDPSTILLMTWLQGVRREERVIRVEDWAEIRRLNRGEGMAVKAIARQLGISKNTVKRALASDRPPRYQRAGSGSVVDRCGRPKTRAAARHVTRQQS
jgi:DNA invertase Pin-like site-specific DNA recombinase